MGRKLPVPIVGQAYADDTLSWAAQESINYYPVLAEADGTRSVAMLKGTPGLTSFGTIGTGTVRGMIVMAGVLYVVADTTLYSVASDGTETSLGTIEGSGRVGIAENGIPGQLVVVNGSKGWVYDKDTGAFAEITDADFPEADDCCFIGDYIVFVDQDTDQFFWSDLSNATSYDALNFDTPSTFTDGTLGVVNLQNELWVFGGSSVEIFALTGSDATFERRTVIERGLAATFAKAKLDNTVYWLGENGIVYRAEGYSARRVSTGPIEQAIGDETLSEAFAFAYEEKGHAFFVLTFPSGKTWVYDVATQMWHRRKSFGLDRWRANAYAFAYGKHLVGDTSNGTVWEIDEDAYTEGSDPLIATRRTQYFHRDGNPFTVSEVEVFFKGGVGIASGQGSNPLAMISYSRDGRLFTSPRHVSMGKSGEYTRRARIFQLGQFRNSIMLEISVSDPVNRDIIGASAR